MIVQPAAAEDMARAKNAYSPHAAVRTAHLPAGCPYLPPHFAWTAMGPPLHLSFSFLFLTGVAAGTPTAATPDACEVVETEAATAMPLHVQQRCRAACTLATVEALVASSTSRTEFDHHPFGTGGWGRVRERPVSVYKRDVPQDQYVPVRSYSNKVRLSCAMEHTLAGHDPDLKHRTYYPTAAALWNSVPLTPPPQRCYRRRLKEEVRPCVENAWRKCTYQECETVAAECDTDWVRRAPYVVDFAQTATDLEELKTDNATLGAGEELACGVTAGNWTALLWRKDGDFKGWGRRAWEVCVGCELRRKCVRIAQVRARATYPDTLSARDVAQAAAGHPYTPASEPEDLLYENALARQFWPRADIPGAVATAKRIQAEYDHERFVASRLLWRGEGEVRDESPWSKIC